MNERIKELAMRSGFKVDWQHEDVQTIKMARFEKFAELIVEECATWVNDNVGMVSEETRADLLKHFGVE